MKKVMVYLFISFMVLLVFILLFINLNPAFGGNPSKTQKEQFSQLDNYVNGKFNNPETTKLTMSATDYFS